MFYYFVTFLVLCLFYCIFSIYKEFNYTPSHNLLVDDVLLSVPNWWTFDDSTQIFKRTDTYYDWFAQLKKLGSSEEILRTQKLLDFAHHYFIKEDIVFDPGEWVEKQLSSKKAVFIQGTCTYQKEKRSFWEGLFWISAQKSEIYVFFSFSSILNGGIEGPYFEKVVENLLKSTTNDSLH